VKYVWTSIRMLLVTAVAFGLIYPLVMTGISQVVFHDRANGSLIKVNGQVVGSKLIGQDFTAAKYFQPRPSAAGNGYNAMDSSPSNLGPTSRTLIQQVRADVRQHLAQDPGLRLGKIPVDMVTTSGSGLDPDISVAAALDQVNRVATARKLPAARLRQLVETLAEGRTLGFLGEPRVNVLALNLALDRAAASP